MTHSHVVSTQQTKENNSTMDFVLTDNVFTSAQQSPLIQSILRVL